MRAMDSVWSFRMRGMVNSSNGLKTGWNRYERSRVNSVPPSFEMNVYSMQLFAPRIFPSNRSVRGRIQRVQVQSNHRFCPAKETSSRIVSLSCMGRSRTPLTPRDWGCHAVQCPAIVATSNTASRERSTNIVFLHNGMVHTFIESV